ncbi:Acyltransferase 3 [Rhodopseudomonas palustris HaA2]|uniref:Acyltransferase 3 n=1 Tax=Rhodopseudomonas palustris (strain HaA2) TaxID=316058 RepID=Q2J3E7_RHOP2|nr:acyltransferase family protein [Rhodopseudomonas palustris]ABD05013.1 Acyltransferase 3 [Rhodopseudomonas palustris HaA2]
MRPTYRSDIDGLRAIAVLLVIAFHAFPHSVRGGFVGVDVFFVISGFLITSIICQARRSGDFSFAVFYARRINRIFPALALVLITCAVAGWFLLFPVDYRDAGKAIGFGAAFLSNLALLHGAGYFETSSELDPLLHLWSLGVEEQFYLLWPPVIVLAWRWPRGALIAALTILLASFAANIALTPVNPLAAFYLPVTRFWELMTGCVLALAANAGPGRDITSIAALGVVRRLFERHAAAIRAACAWLGLGLLAAGAALISNDRGFPGWWAVLPVLGAALLIFAGPSPWVSRYLLGNRAMVYVGLISYPLYLWHWPLLAAIRIVRFGEEPPLLMKAITILVAFALAHLTWRFIEPPFRARPSRRKTAAAFAAVAIAGIAGAGIYAASGFPSRFGPDLQAILGDLNAEATVAFRAGACFFEGSAQFQEQCDDATPADAPRVVLWGDSHAAQLYPGLREWQRADNSFRISQYTTAGCPPILGLPDPPSKVCAANNAMALERLRTLKPDTVIMVARQWHDYHGPDRDPQAVDEMIRATLAEVRATGVRRIVVVGMFPNWRTPPRRILAGYYRARAAGVATAGAIPERDRSRHLDSSRAEENEGLRRFFEAAGVAFVSPTSTYCDRDGCLLAVPRSNGTPVVYDGSHLTAASSIFFVRETARQLFGR